MNDNIVCPCCGNQTAGFLINEAPPEAKCSVCNGTSIVPKNIANFIVVHFYLDGGSKRYKYDASPDRSMRIQYDLQINPTSWEIIVFEHSDIKLTRKEFKSTTDIVNYLMNVRR